MPLRSDLVLSEVATGRSTAGEGRRRRIGHAMPLRTTNLFEATGRSSGVDVRLKRSRDDLGMPKEPRGALLRGEMLEGMATVTLNLALSEVLCRTSQACTATLGESSRTKDRDMTSTGLLSTAVFVPVGSVWDVMLVVRVFIGNRSEIGVSFL